MQATLEPVGAKQPASEQVLITKPEVPSQWIWVPFIWLFFAGTRTLSTWLHPGVWDSDSSAGSPIDEVLVILLMALGLYVLNLRAERVKRILSRNKWVVALFFYMALTIIWSNFPGISIRRWIRSAGTLVMVLVALTEPDPLGAMRTLLRRFYILHIPLSILAIKYFRNIGVQYDWSGSEEQWVGISTDKNSLGQVAMCSGVYFTWEIFENWPKKKLTLNLLFLVLTLWLLRGSKNSHSSTSIIAYIICAVLLIGLQLIRKRATRAKRILLGFTIATVLFAPFVYAAFAAFDTTPTTVVFSAAGRDMSFTDRTLIWTDLLHISERNPVLGVGVGALWVGPTGYAIYPMPNWSAKTPGWRPEEGHNGYLDVYVELGAIGIVLLFIVICAGFAGALDDMQKDFALGSLRLVLLLSVLINNITETSFLKGTHDLWFLFLLLAINVPRSTPRIRLKHDTHIRVA